MSDEVRTQYRLVTVTKGEVTKTEPFDDLGKACDALIDATGGAGIPFSDVDDLAAHFQEFGPIGVDMGCGVKLELLSRRVVSIEPDWAGIREFVRAMARDDPDAALKFNASLGGEGVDEGELRPIRKGDRLISKASGSKGVAQCDEFGRGDRTQFYAGSKGWSVRVLWDDGSEYNVPVPALRIDTYEDDPDEDNKPDSVGGDGPEALKDYFRI
ncbi:MAG: hypothetical protein ACRDPE_23480 [Solirubrobacterales bacterium]